MHKISNNLIDKTLFSLRNALEQKSNCSVFGLSFGEKAYFLASQNRQVVFVTTSILDADKLKKQLNSLGKNVQVIFFNQNELLIGTKTYGQNVVDTISSLTALCKSDVDCLIVSPEVLMQKFASKTDFLKSLLTLKKGEIYSQKQLGQHLIKLGYKKVDIVQTVGEFSVRGDIVDIYNFCDELPTRIDFFDDEIEQISNFGIDDFKKINSLKEFTIVPTSIIPFVENKSQLFEKVKQDFEKTKKQLQPNEQVILSSNFEEFKLYFDSDNFGYINNWIFPFLDDVSFKSYLNSDALIVFDDVKQIVDKVNGAYLDYEKNYDALIKTGNILLCHKNYFVDKTKIFDFNNQLLSFQQITTANRIFNPDEVLSFKSSAQTLYNGNFNLLVEDINYYLEFKNTVIIFAKDKYQAEYLLKFLSSAGIKCEITDFDKTSYGQVNIVAKYVPFGAIFVEDRIVLIGSDELKQQAKKQAKISTGNKKEEFTLPKIGDYVVHETFGVGLCTGILKLKFTDYEKDYVILQYDGGDKLYLPTEQIGLISGYVAGGKTPKLNKLGTKDFEKTKEKVKASLKELAFDLIKLYSQRQHAKGYTFELDEKLFAELENSFAYTTTLDQQTAIEEIKKDMCSDKIMDRLVCGDVGYGKTEVAIRSAFISAMNNKQVAFLAPTTVLSQQHFNTAKERLAKFGIEVECLNRFKSKKEQADIIKRLKEGKIDVICGTHRLLSKDVVFKDLGLLILDEEQRFGVGDKEKIKNLRTNIDVLTLSATPIPRTLHMGLVGIRDISIIASAPEGRLPVQTTVTELSDGLLVQAINRELSRGGQVLIIYNRVETIYEFAHHIQNLVEKDVKIGVAHGQMPEKELEKQILNLYEGETQILVSTTLIENGVDLPNANTLIIIDSDKLGLSQLYQLKGRVGRSKNLGYAYFTYNKDRVLSEDAYKRLNAIMEFTELGSGFKIAMRDLEIRGCGNILGVEQSGHMAKVGYDMYCKILNEAVQEIKGQSKKEYKDIKLDVAIDSFIPENFITQSDERFKIYTSLKQIDSEQKRQAVLNEIQDSFGKLPDELQNLSYVALLRNLAREFDVKRISIDRQRCQAEYYVKDDMVLKCFADALKQKNVGVYYAQTGSIVNFMLSEFSVKRKLTLLCEIYELALNLKNKGESKSKK